MSTRFVLSSFLVAALAACAAPQTGAPDAAAASNWPGTAALAGKMRDHRYVLLGEQHDNAVGHQRRYEALALAVEQGWRPAIAMEQFDREQAGVLAQAQAECGLDPDCVIERAAPGKSGWEWAFYRPVVALALQYDLPLVAANLSRTDGGKVRREGLGAVFSRDEQARLGFGSDVPGRLLPLHNQVFAGMHGGQASAAMVAPFSLAQMARDAVMADSLRRTDGRPAVLIAGNGHVRRDIGVAPWLAVPEAEILTVGFGHDPDEAARFDAWVEVPAVSR